MEGGFGDLAHTTDLALVTVAQKLSSRPAKIELSTFERQLTQTISDLGFGLVYIFMAASK